MAPVTKTSTGGVRTRCEKVKTAISHAEGHTAKVKQMLCSTLAVTIGTHKAERHPFNERFVTMIQQVLEAERVRQSKDIASKEAAFAQLAPAKATREAALEQAKAVAAAKNEASEHANKEVTAINATLKSAKTALKNSKLEQQNGDAEIEGVIAKKAMVETVRNESLAPVVAGTAGEDKAKKISSVLNCCRSITSDTSLMDTAKQVLEREAAERGAFDQTCLDQLQAAFATAIAKFDEEIAALAPGKAERQTAVDHCQAELHAAEFSLANLKEKAAAAKEAKAGADSEKKAASKSLDDFMPELKAAGDGLDGAKRALQNFQEGPQTAFNELRELKEGDFAPKRTYYEQIDGLKCDREVIDACRQAVAGRGDGRVSVEDAHQVFVAIADNNKVTQAERWTLRYCMTEFHWTEGAHDWIVDEMQKVPQEGKSAKKARTGGKGYYEVIDGVKCDRELVDACRLACEGAGDGRVSLEDAQSVWAKAADGKGVTNTEKWTLRYCLCAFRWTRPGHAHVLEQLKGLEAVA